MSWLIDKIRSWFCKHEWECIVSEVPVVGGGQKVAYKWLYICKKCMKQKVIVLDNTY